MNPELTITNLAITTIETVTPKTIDGYRAAIDTFNGMLADNLTQDEVIAIEAAKERAWQAGQKLQLKINQITGDL